MSFERELGATAASLGCTPDDVRDLLKGYRRAAKLLAERASALQSRESYIAFADYVMPNIPKTNVEAMYIAQLFHAMQAIDAAEGIVRGCELASCVDDRTIFECARMRAGIPSTFLISDAQVNRLRTLVS